MKMGSLGVEAVKKKKAMWLYPKVLGFNPSERWGHSACFSDGFLYVFGGCCGGLHFSDVLTLNMDTMTWASIKTTGQKPGTRDSHSASIMGNKMIILGGTNGSKKVNDFHVLDLETKEWSKPNCKGIPPSPRESHTATVVDEDRLVIFGGSGEGEANYLNDVHVLDLETMTWSSPIVKGDVPAPRDSHTAVAIGNKLIIYGGDCGDRYHGEVDILDMETMTWSRLDIKGPSPGVRAGHAAVNIGNKVYVIGGVGDKQYYSDVWVLDIDTCSWTLLEIRGQPPQGRFSHTAIVTNTDIAIYGGCGEDERPLNEFLILQLGSEHPNGRYNISMCKIFGNQLSQQKRKFLRGDENVQRSFVKNVELNERPHDLEEADLKNSKIRRFDSSNYIKRRKICDPKPLEVELEQEEHSLSLSQHSSPTQSDQENNNNTKVPSIFRDSISPSQPFIHPKMHQRVPQEVHLIDRESPNQSKTEQFLRTVPNQRQEVQFLGDQKTFLRPVPHLIGADVRGTVDGAFDSGYLMTANVNGQIFRGVLFAPGPCVGMARPVLQSNVVAPPQCSGPTHAIPIHRRPSSNSTSFDCGHRARHGHNGQSVKAQPSRLNSDLQGVVLTLGGPGGSNVGSSS